MSRYYVHGKVKAATAKMDRRAFLALGGASLIVGLLAKAGSARAGKINLTSGLAIGGYDPVAYFTQNTAVKGTGDFTADHDGATYQFASAEHRDMFTANPARYVPQYGGFCAYAVSRGYTAKIDPQAFSVVNDRLFLNYSKGVRSIWSKDVPGNITLGDQNWPSLSAS